MRSRLTISRDINPIPCELCGRNTLCVARMVSDDGIVLGRTAVCTFCRPRFRVDGARFFLAGVAAGS